MTSDYRRLLERLLSARRFGMRFGLDRVRGCLDRLGAPDQSFAAVQIGGTNGKGSTAAFTAAIASAAGARVGLFTSPHLCRLGERIVVDGAEASPDELVAAGAAVVAAGGGELTFFEQLTCMAAWLLAERGVEIAIFEVGLGGRLDATTAIDAEIAAVTGVALDHQAYLGDDLAAIAAEKGAIFRPGRPAIIGVAGEPEGREMLRAAAEATGAAPVRLVDEGDIDPATALGLAGDFQRGNAAAAVAIAEALASRGLLAIDAGAIERGLAAARLPGRLERVASSPEIILDVGHNPAAATRLAAELPWRRPVIVVLGVSADKDAAGIARALAPGAASAIATAARSDRALAIGDVAAALRDANPALVVDEIEGVAAAIDRARASVPPGGLVLVTGSVFVVGEARAHLLDDPIDPIATSDPAGGAPRQVARDPGQA